MRELILSAMLCSFFCTISPTWAEKNPQIHSVRLGSLRFDLTRIRSQSQRRLLAVNLKKAYRYLARYLGPTVLVGPKYTIPVIHVLSQGSTHGSVSRGVMASHISGRWKVQKVYRVSLVQLRTTADIAQITHELCHIANPFMVSMSYAEGICYAIEFLVRNETRNSIDHFEKFGATSISQTPWDYTPFDKSQGGGLRGPLEVVVSLLWGHAWIELYNKDKKFFQKFFLRLQKEKKNFFSKSELELIGRRASTHFTQWRKTHPILASMGKAHGFSAVRKGNQVLFLNFKTIPPFEGTIYGREISRPAMLIPLHKGDIWFSTQFTSLKHRYLLSTGAVIDLPKKLHPEKKLFLNIGPHRVLVK